ncbi:MAG: flavin reductase family protein [Candidatus Marinimicrobia bacterium]|nr:flavin reductase family protein [Candidatus Neomarinimicrobiota bacterium]
MNLEDKKTILRKIPNGLFIITARDGDNATGAVISFVTQISIDPSYIALSIRKNSSFYDVAEKSKYLAIHLPSKEQQSMVSSFIKIKDQSHDSINGYSFKWSELDNPLLDDIPMILEVKIIEKIDIGDHPIFICEVVNTILRQEVEMLTMVDTNWHYGG